MYTELSSVSQSQIRTGSEECTASLPPSETPVFHIAHNALVSSLVINDRCSSDAQTMQFDITKHNLRLNKALHLGQKLDLKCKHFATKCMSFWSHLVQIDGSEWRDSRWYRRVYLSVRTIPYLVCSVCVPVVDLEQKVQNNWNRTLICINVICAPQAAYYLLSCKLRLRDHITIQLSEDLLLLPQYSECDNRQPITSVGPAVPH